MTIHSPEQRSSTTAPLSLHPNQCSHPPLPPLPNHHFHHHHRRPNASPLTPSASPNTAAAEPQSPASSPSTNGGGRLRLGSWIGHKASSLRPPRSLKRRLQRLLGERSKDHNDHSETALRRPHSHHPHFHRRHAQRRGRREVVDDDSSAGKDNVETEMTLISPHRDEEETAIKLNQRDVEEEVERVQHIVGDSKDILEDVDLDDVDDVVGDEEEEKEENDGSLQRQYQQRMSNEQESYSNKKERYSDVSDKVAIQQQHDKPTEQKTVTLHQDDLMTVTETSNDFKLCLSVRDHENNHIKVRVNPSSRMVHISGHQRRVRPLKDHEVVRHCCRHQNDGRRRIPMVHTEEKQCFERFVHLPRTVDLSTMSSNFGADAVLVLRVCKYPGSCFHSMNSPNH